jgi:hypothetical protein
VKWWNWRWAMPVGTGRIHDSGAMCMQAVVLRIERCA